MDHESHALSSDPHNQRFSFHFNALPQTYGGICHYTIAVKQQ
jgi:hypothetical protein